MGRIFRKKWLLSLILLSFLTVTFAQNETDNTENVDKIFKVYQDNGIDAALSAYDKMPENNEYNGLQEPLNLLGYRLLNDENDADAAAAVFKAQIKEHPNEPNPYDSYADALIEKGEDEEAMNQLNKSLELLKNAEDNDFNNNLILASKSKLAKLKGLNKVFSFLDGDWKVKIYRMENGEKVLRNTDDVRFIPSKMNSAMVMVMSNENDGWEATQLIAYDALENSYDVVRTNNMQLNGVQTAKMKIEEYSTNRLVLIETMEQNGEQNRLKHIINKSGDNADWEVFETSENGEEKIIHRELKKKN